MRNRKLVITPGGDTELRKTKNIKRKTQNINEIKINGKNARNNNCRNLKNDSLRNSSIIDINNNKNNNNQGMQALRNSINEKDKIYISNQNKKKSTLTDDEKLKDADDEKFKDTSIYQKNHINKPNNNKNSTNNPSRNGPTFNTYIPYIPGLDDEYNYDNNYLDGFNMNLYNNNWLDVNNSYIDNFYPTMDPDIIF